MKLQRNNNNNKIKIIATNCDDNGTIFVQTYVTMYYGVLLLIDGNKIQIVSTTIAVEYACMLTVTVATIKQCRGTLLSFGSVQYCLI